jgi:uncharacterized repeat protein (TIGR03803 family)
MIMFDNDVRRPVLAAAWLSAAVFLPAAASAQSLTTLYAFTGGNDGAEPAGALLIDGSHLYGVSGAGGSLGNGTVFDVLKGGKHTESTVAAITQTFPLGGLTDVAGTAYSVSLYGGANGLGSIFSVNLATGAFADVHDFNGTDGKFPAGGVLYSDGTLYGTTSGNNSTGTLFAFDISTGVLTTLYTFGSGSDAAVPNGNLLLKHGKLYGAGQSGGTSGNGAIFAYDLKTKKETVLYSFTGNADGAAPVGGLVYSDGTLYGTAFYGGNGTAGTVFAVNAVTGAETTLYSFTGGADGGLPFTGVILDGGVLYGTAYAGGAGQAGTIFAVNAATGADTTLYSFTGGTDGGFPYGGLTVKGGIFYGTTEIDGAGGNGTVFAFKP